MPKPAEPRFPLSVILRALSAARIPEADRERFVKQLRKLQPRPGPKGYNDSEDISRVLELADEELGVSIPAAAAMVARDYPEWQRSAVRKRLARKTRALMDETKEDLREATLRAVAKSKERDEELQRLRKEVADLRKQR